MNDYKIMFYKDSRPEYLKADRVEYTTLGFAIFYINSEVVGIVNNPLAVVKKPEQETE